jgi:hypothetical protein
VKEITYTFNNLGCYLPDQTPSFGAEKHLKLIVKPHQFELKLSNEVLRSSKCDGYIIEVSHRGGVRFYDKENTLLTETAETENEFAQVGLSLKQDKLLLSFGQEETVDHYPNCDGEHDRYSTKWVSMYEVSLDTVKNKAEVAKL